MVGFEDNCHSFGFFSLKLAVKLPSVLEATNLHVFKVHSDKYQKDKSTHGLLNSMPLSAVIN